MKTRYLYGYVMSFVMLSSVISYAENIAPNKDDSQYTYGENIGRVNFETKQYAYGLT